ncbi:UNVERIFIED_CONTAM: hypothetical protein FKN15_042027 [Acipenser sinensis]
MAMSFIKQSEGAQRRGLSLGTLRRGQTPSLSAVCVSETTDSKAKLQKSLKLHLMRVNAGISVIETRRDRVKQTSVWVPVLHQCLLFFLNGEFLYL